MSAPVTALPLPAHEPMPSPAHWREVLTPRQASALALVALGWSNREVAEALCVSEQTVKFHMCDILRNLGARNRVEAARWWWQVAEKPARHALTVVE